MIEQPTILARLKPVVILVAFVGVFFLAKQLPGIGPAIRSGEAVLARGGAGIARAVARFFESENSLSVRLQMCQDDGLALARDAVEFERLKDENAELRESLGYSEHVAVAGTAARLIARSLPEDPMRVILDRGSADKVVIGSVVVVGQGVVLGTVTAVKEHTSIVTLLTGSDSRIPATIIGKKRTIGLAEGRNGAVIGLNFIPREADVARGDIVTTSGLDGRITEGLLLGTVTEVINHASAPFKSALLEPFADPLEWSNVLILPPISP